MKRGGESKDIWWTGVEWKLDNSDDDTTDINEDTDLNKTSIISQTYSKRSKKFQGSVPPPVGGGVVGS